MNVDVGCKWMSAVGGWVVGVPVDCVTLGVDVAPQTLVRCTNVGLWLGLLRAY